MASIRRLGKRWRVQLYRDGARASKVFDSKAEAQYWAMANEGALSKDHAPERFVRDALTEYRDKKAHKLAGATWAKRKLGNLLAHPLADKPLLALTRGDMAAWRDDRETKVSPGTVNRELNLWHSVLTYAVELQWLPAHPMKGLKRPQNPPARRRRVTDAEIAAVVAALGYRGGEPVTLSQRVALAFLFAIETAMRGGEIVRLQWAHVGAKSVLLPKTKNGDARSVPLSKAALSILDRMPVNTDPDASVFMLTDAQKDALFRKGRDRAGVKNLHFHDSRAEAIWRISKKLDVLELSLIIGHRNLSSLRLYYNASADELADKLG
jgi:integrase